MLASTGHISEPKGSRDHAAEVFLWSLVTGQKTILETDRDTDSIDLLAFTGDGRSLAGGGNGLRLWDVSTGKLTRNLVTGDRWGLTGMTVSSRGDVMAIEKERGIDIVDIRTGERRATINKTDRITQHHALAFSSDDSLIATCDYTGTVQAWEVATGKALVLTRATILRFPSFISRPVTVVQDVVSLTDRIENRILATLIPFSEKSRTAQTSKNPQNETQSLASENLEWITATTEGYFDCSANAAKFIKWNVNGELYPAERYLRRFRRPDLVRKALRGERITAPAMTGDDIPPAVRFVKPLRGEAVQGDFVKVTVEARDDRRIKEVELFVDSVKVPAALAKPQAVLSRPIEVGAKDIDPNYRIVKQFTFRVPLPPSSNQPELRAVAYDDTDLGSDPAVIFVRRLDARPVAGRLFVLSVGVGRYKGSGFRVQGSGERIKDLRYPAEDAQAVAKRFGREGPPMYQKVAPAHLLLDEQATLANVRKELQWLRESVSPNQTDTVIVYLSGHGFSENGHYFFGIHDFDPKNPTVTGLAGRS